MILAGLILIPLAVLLFVLSVSLVFVISDKTLSPTGENLQPVGPTVIFTPPTFTLQPPTLTTATQTGSGVSDTPFPTAQPQTTDLPAISPAPTVTASDVDIDRLLASMSIEEKIGQMIMTGVSGRTLTAADADLIRSYRIGSVVYFGENTYDATQTRRLSLDLQAAAAEMEHRIPLLIAVDHEGGTVFRFQHDLTHFPNQMALGAIGSTDLAMRLGAANAQELRAVGVNLSLGPVLDVNDQPLNPVIGVRAFGGFPEPVAQLGAAYIHGLQSGGVIAAAKHYPGHGSTTTDSHETLPVVNKNLDALFQTEMVPFRMAVEAGVGVVMVGHIAFPQVDVSGAPASLSPLFIQQILREDMGFDGLVMTDAMSMGAIQGGYSPGEAALLSVEAGNDLLAYTGAEAAVSARNFLLTAVHSGRLPVERIDQAARRVLELKRRFGLFGAAPPDGQFDRREHAELAHLIARTAITAHGSATIPLLPVDRVLLVTPDRLPVGETAGDGLSLLGEQLTRRGFQVDEWVYPVSDANGIVVIQSQALEALQNYPLAIVVTWDAMLYADQRGKPAQSGLVAAMQSTGKPLILIAAGSPFDLYLMLPGSVGLATYGGLDFQIQALVDALGAETLPVGRLPVPLSPPN